MTSQNTLRGVGTALVTPMKSDGSVDEKGFRSHIEFQIEQGAHFLVPCGTTGESATLLDDEQRRVIEVAVDTVSGRVPVVAGAGTNSTEHAVRLAQAAAEVGADAVLSVSPYYNKPTPAGIEAHYTRIAEASGLPTIVYNVPGRTAANLSAEVTLALAEHELIAGVKEASGDLAQIMQILRHKPDGFTVLSGDDDLTLAVLALGGDGVISVAANEIPALMAALCEHALGSRIEEARAIHYRVLPLLQANFIEANPIPVKEALVMMGRLEEAHYRLPLCPLSEEAREPLRSALALAGALGDEE